MDTPLPLSDRASSFFIPPPPPFVTARSDNAITLWPQNLADQQLELEAPPSKRPRISDDAPHQNPPQNTPPASTMPPPPNPQTNPPSRGPSCMFFKTRLCHKFKAGSCPYGSSCIFAHGIEELRRPPPNWQELVAEERVNGNDRQRMHTNKICRKFYNGEVCQYGNRCIYLHVERENSGMAMGSMTRPDGSAAASNGSAAASNGSNQKPKAKICYRWLTTCHCSHGQRCNFAHGLAELKNSEDHMEIDSGEIEADPSKPLTNPTDNVPPIQTEPSCTHQAQQKKGAFPKLSRKLSCIYADWIDDTSFVSPHLLHLSKQS